MRNVFTLPNTLRILAGLAFVFAIYYYVISSTTSIIQAKPATIGIDWSLILVTLLFFITSVAYTIHYKKEQNKITELSNRKAKFDLKKMFSSPGFTSFISVLLTQYKDTSSLLPCLKPAIIAGILAYTATTNPNSNVDPNGN